MPPPTIIVCAPRTPEGPGIIIDSLQLETNEKYKPTVFPGVGKRTKCNFAAKDYCDLMGVHMPQGLLAREQIAWLLSPAGRAEKWFELLRKAADEAVAKGQPVLVCWVNPVPEQSSHIAMMRAPGRIGQAGASNFCDGTVAQGFGARVVRYVGHL